MADHHLPPDDAPVITGDRLGLVVGHSLADDALRGGAERLDVETPWGSVALLTTEHAVLLPRHGLDRFRAAHLVDHHRNIAGVCAAGCDRIVALGSVGSLRGWPVGTVVCPYDSFGFAATPSYFTDRRGHRVPGFDEPWRDALVAAWEAVTDTPLMDGGVYAQTTGPRFETPAEVRFLAGHADVVGMTLVSESTLAGEAGLAYAALCTIDNLANGVAGERLDLAEYHANVATFQGRLLDDLARLLPHLASTPRPAPAG
jgi:5'-methylthioadenosine phosphorylase